MPRYIDRLTGVDVSPGFVHAAVHEKRTHRPEDFEEIEDPAPAPSPPPPAVSPPGADRFSKLEPGDGPAESGGDPYPPPPSPAPSPTGPPRPLPKRR